ncbi:hypothetical protein N1851_024709 [Merluccius polli]|uniref:Uncharacterized protein n=1 Tax=Merluccius polli TaxID=89951 RepID=A0AA47MEP8_MERPO|nr:hypothetical protein N1851_024709 [Merluccius polli]
MADLPLEHLSTCSHLRTLLLCVREVMQQKVSARQCFSHARVRGHCMHFKLIESMNTSSCVNALHWFFTIHGQAKQLRSDFGTNFLGASRGLGMPAPLVPSQKKTSIAARGEGFKLWPMSSGPAGKWEYLPTL